MKAVIWPYLPQMREEVLNLKLRDSDVVEVFASSSLTPREALGISLDQSTKAWVIKYDDEIIAAFGVCVSLADSTVGVPWLLGSTGLHNIKFRIIKYSGLIVRDMLFFGDLKCLTNFVSVTHTEAIKWLKWLGFEILEPEVYLVNPDIPFKQFVKWRKH